MNKKNLIALIVLLLAAGIYLMINMNEPTEKVFLYFGENSDSFHTIVISDTTGAITLVKNSDEWEMTDPVESPIKKTKADELIKKLSEAKTSSLPISISETAQKTYNVTDSLGTLITILDAQGNELRTALIGKSDNYSFSYARHPQASEIYQLSENITWSIKPDVKSWRENNILKLETDNILDFQVITEDRDYTFTYADSLWKFAENDLSLDVQDNDEVLKKLLNHFKSLRAVDFLDKEFENYEELLMKPSLSVKINTSDTGSKILTVIPYNETNDLLQVGSQKSPLYLVQKNLMGDFNFDLDKLVKSAR
jgi:hypothetical protein